MLRLVSRTRTALPALAARRCGAWACSTRSVNMAAMASSAAPPAAKREGDISDSFASLAGVEEKPLPDRFRELKLSLAAGHEQALDASWRRLLAALKQENGKIRALKSKVVPTIDYKNLHEIPDRVKDEITNRGVAVIRGVIPSEEARSWKFDIEEYVRKNPSTRGFPQHDRQVFELYWSVPQVRARAYRELLTASRLLLEKFWHPGSDDAEVDLSTPISYADRLRIRQPGDASFSLGPHQDGGSVERWEREGYGRGRVYDPIFAGRWDSPPEKGGFDPWDAGARVASVTNLYNGLGACSVFRAFQGWLSISQSAAYQGTLLVYPAMRLATAYTLLRPFFRPVRASDEFEAEGGVASPGFLDESNWVFTAGNEMTSDLQGATPGHGQEYPRAELHPHLDLARTMVHIPSVEPGDFVVWHCDTIHAVDPTHAGQSDSSVLYIPVCPVTELNAQYLVRQRQAFRDGTPGPDFPGGKGESEHVGRPTEEFLRGSTSPDGLQAFGLEKIPIPAGEEGLRPGARAVREQHNNLLGF